MLTVQLFGTGSQWCPLPWALPVPLRVHGHYSRAEIEAAFGVLSDHAPWIHREGVLWHEPSECDLLFVTLRKSEALFSPTTRYRRLAHRAAAQAGHGH
jgi:hypothetical protein